MGHTPSPRQAAIYAALPLPEHLLIQACAGSGKTTTLAGICDHIPTSKRAIALCFNKAIAEEFQRRLPGHVEARTLHSLGFGAVKRANRAARVDDRKLRAILDTLPTLTRRPEAERGVLRSDLDIVVGLVTDMHLDPTDASAIDAACAQTGRVLESPASSLPLLPEVMERMDADKGTISFGEMLRHPLIHGYSLPQYDVVLIDEAQDLSPVQHLLLARVLAEGGKLIAVGDRFQSIYGFRGADPRSMDRLKAQWDMTEYPLDVSYRCPRAVVKLAQAVVGDGIQPAPTAPDGVVEERPASALAKTEASLIAGDMVLCRINAPLVPMAFRLLKRGQKALLRGRDLGAGLAALVRRLRADNVGDLITKGRAWADKEADRLRRADKPASSIQAVEDKVDCLLAFAEEARTVADVILKIENMFTDACDASAVMLSTVHKAKGLEAERVIVIRPDLLPAPWAKSEVDRAQERNVQYVAYTRAKHTLILQAAPDDKAKKRDRETAESV